MERTLITSNLSMTDLHPATAARASTSFRRVQYISPAASASAQNSSYRKTKKSTPSPPPSAAATATVLTSPPATDNVQYTTPKQTEKQEEDQVVAKTNTSRTATAKTSQAQARPRRRPAAAAVSLPRAFCSELEEAINTFVDPPALRPSVDPRNVLSTKFAPVDELPPTPCPVVRGAIPRCLAGGAYIRNGPNRQHLPRGPHHLFDGDSMLHSLLLPTAESSPSPTPSCARATCRRTSNSWSATPARRSCRTSSPASTAWPGWRAAPSWRPGC